MIRYIYFFLIVFSTYCGAALPPKITLSVPQESAVEGRDIPLYVTIVHDPQDVIDTSSFMLEGMPYKIREIRKEKVAPESLFKDTDEDVIEVSRFQGMLPGRKPGFYTVGPLSLLINKVRYESGSISIHVQGAVESPVLELQARLLNGYKIFPGQEVSFEYRISYQKPIKLTREDLPLLRVEGFLNVGSPIITDEETSEGGVQIIVQKARAQRPGSFAVKESVIEGFEVETSEGEPRIVSPLYRAKSKSLQFTVQSFPKQGCPPAFDGAIGSYVWRVASLDGVEVDVGQPVRIEYRVSGQGDLSTVRFPPLNQITGLQDCFLTESLSPLGNEIDGVKHFILVVRPKRVGKIEVPGFFTYSFDPVSERYLTTAVAPIALTVEGSQETKVSETQQFHEDEGTFQPLHEVTSEMARKQDMPFSMVVTSLLAFILIGTLESALSKYLGRKKQASSSQKLFYEAISKRSDGYESLKLLQKAFYLRLFEVGLTKKVEEDPSSLADIALVGETKGYLKSVDKALYHRDIAADGFTMLFDEATGLYQKLKKLPRVH